MIASAGADVDGPHPIENTTPTTRQASEDLELRKRC